VAGILFSSFAASFSASERGGPQTRPKISGRRFNQYNEDFFVFEFKLLTRFFRITSLEVKKRSFSN